MNQYPYGEAPENVGRTPKSTGWSISIAIWGLYHLFDPHTHSWKTWFFSVNPIVHGQIPGKSENHGRTNRYGLMTVDGLQFTLILTLAIWHKKNPKGLHRRGKAMVFIREIVFKWWVFSTSNWVIHAMIRWQTSASGFASKGFTPHARLESASGCRCGLDDTWECHVSHWHLTHWHDIIYIYICIYYIIWFINIVSIYVCMYGWMDASMDVSMDVCIGMYIYVYVCKCVCMCICMYLYVYVCNMCMYMYVNVCKCMYMYVYVCICICMCMCMCMCICMYVYMHACMHACMHVCMHACMYAYMHVCMYACMHVCMYLSIYVSMYLCMGKYIYIPIHIITWDRAFADDILWACQTPMSLARWKWKLGVSENWGLTDIDGHWRILTDIDHIPWIPWDCSGEPKFSDKTNSKMRCAFGNFTMRAMLATKEIHQLCTGFTSGKLGVTTVASTEMSKISWNLKVVSTFHLHYMYFYLYPHCVSLIISHKILLNNGW